MRMKSVLRSPILPILLLILLAGWWHTTLGFMRGDDLAYAKTSFTPAFLMVRYTSWSSRVLVETVILFLTHHAVFLWKILDIGMMAAFCSLLVYHAFPQRLFSVGMWCVLGIACLFPLEIFQTAGWCTTTVQYLWPVTAALFVMIPWKRMMQGEKISPFLAIASLPALIFALNFEMVLFFCAPIFLFLIVRKWKVNKLRPFLLSYAVIFGMSILFIALCPGNRIRYIKEAQTWWPDYATTGLCTKMMLSLENMGSYFLLQDKMTVLLCVLLAWLAWYKKSLLPRGISAVPLAIKIVSSSYFFYTTMILHENLRVLTIRPEDLPQFLSPSLNSAMALELHLLILFSFLFFVGIGSSFIMLCHDAEKGWLLFAVYLLGFGTAFAMAFSPTLFSSSTRIFFVFYAAVMFLCLCLIRERITEGVFFLCRK